MLCWERVGQSRPTSSRGECPAEGRTSGPRDPSWVPEGSCRGLDGPPTCISSSCRLFAEGGGPGILGSLEDLLTPKESLDVSSQQAGASCSVLALLPSLLGFPGMGCATNMQGLESTTPYKDCFLGWQGLEAERCADEGCLSSL